jgi:hypothetical protein
MLSWSPSSYGCTAIVPPVITIRTISILYSYYNPYTNSYFTMMFSNLIWGPLAVLSLVQAYQVFFPGTAIPRTTDDYSVWIEYSSSLLIRVLIERYLA